MQIDHSINQHLNDVLRFELTIINQTFLHARMLQNWGFNLLGEQEYEASITAMKLADRLINRILFLEGLPNLQDLDRLRIGENAAEVISGDHEIFALQRDQLTVTIRHCEGHKDFQSREHLQALLHECEERVDFYETQESLIADVGLENYLQSQMGSEESHD